MATVPVTVYKETVPVIIYMETLPLIIYMEKCLFTDFSVSIQVDSSACSPPLCKPVSTVVCAVIGCNSASRHTKYNWS